MQKGIVIYTRVSTAEQADKGHSLSHQEFVLTHFSEINKDEILKHFQDDFSAKTFDRPQWNELMTYVLANRKIVNEIHVLRWDRFSRNLENALKVIRDLKKLGISVNAIEQPLDMDSPDHKVLLALYLVMPEVENDKNSMLTTESSRKARLEGCWTGTPPIGYKNYRNANSKSTLISNEKAELVHEAFVEVAKNQCSVDNVRKQMKKRGLKLVKQAFLNMLRNVAYTGRVSVKEWKKENAVVVDGLHSAIINDELFNDVQRILSGKKKQRLNFSKENEALLLRGYLKCPVCEGNLTGGASKGRSKYYNYYKCQNNCIGNIKSEEANAEFEKYLSSLKIPATVSEMYIRIMEDIFKTKEGDKNTKSSLLKEKLKEVELGIERVNEEYFIKQRMDEANYNLAISQFRKKKADLTAELAELQEQDDNFIKYVKFSFPLLTNLDHYYRVAPFRIKQFIIGSIFPEKLYYQDNKYRTTKLNEVLALLTITGKGLEDLEKKKSPEKSGLVQ